MQAGGRVFARVGEKKNRAKARGKFLVAKLGLEEFTRLVEEEREKSPHDDDWTAYIDQLHAWDEKPKKQVSSITNSNKSEAYYLWESKNVHTQRQDGYRVVTIMLPLGDLSSHQMRQLADIAEKYVGDTVRTTVEQIPYIHPS
jgi:sulfite reductase (ferredoxin)